MHPLLVLCNEWQLRGEARLRSHMYLHPVQGMQVKSIRLPKCAHEDSANFSLCCKGASKSSKLLTLEKSPSESDSLSLSSSVWQAERQKKPTARQNVALSRARFLRGEY